MRLLHDLKNYYEDLDKHYLPQQITFSLICINLQIKKLVIITTYLNQLFYDTKIFVQNYTYVVCVTRSPTFILEVYLCRL